MRGIFYFMNYEIDQQKLSEQIILTAKKTAVVSGLYILLVFIIVFALYSIGLFLLFDSPKEFFRLSDPKYIEELLVLKASKILLLNMGVSILMHYFLSGIYGIIKNGLALPYSDIGNAFKSIFSKQGLKVLNVIVLVQILSTGISYFLDLAGFGLVGFGMSLLVQFLTYFTIPSIYISNSGVRKSIQKSISLVNQKPGFLIFFISVTYFLSLIGILFLGIGIILTLPLNYIVAYSLYIHISEQID